MSAYFSYQGIKVSHAGWFLYHTLDGTSLVAENLFSGERIEFDPLVDAVILDWSPGGSYAVLWQKEVDTLWLLSTADKSLVPISYHIPVVYLTNAVTALGSCALHDRTGFGCRDSMFEILNDSGEYQIAPLDAWDIWREYTSPTNRGERM